MSENIKTLKQNSTLIQKQIQLEALEKNRGELEQKVGNLNKTQGRIQEKIDEKKRLILEGMEEERGKNMPKRSLPPQSGSPRSYPTY